MRLYEIDSRIEELIDRETGEISDMEAFEALQMAREDKLEGAACYAKDLAADIKALADEEKALHERRTVLEHKRERLVSWLSTVLDGGAFTTSKVDVRFRRSQALEIPDEDTLREYLQIHAPWFLIAQEPKVDKQGLKDAIKSGVECPCAELVTRQNIQIK